MLYLLSTMLPQLFKKGVGLGQVLAVGALPLIEVGHRVQAQPVDSQAQPEIQRPDRWLLRTSGLSKFRSG